MGIVVQSVEKFAIECFESVYKCTLTRFSVDSAAYGIFSPKLFSARYSVFRKIVLLFSIQAILSFEI